VVPPAFGFALYCRLRHAEVAVSLRPLLRSGRASNMSMSGDGLNESFRIAAENGGILAHRERQLSLSGLNRHSPVRSPLTAAFSKALVTPSANVFPNTMFENSQEDSWQRQQWQSER
jgi:hypothetical protein